MTEPLTTNYPKVNQSWRAATWLIPFLLLGAVPLFVSAESRPYGVLIIVVVTLAMVTGLVGWVRDEGVSRVRIDDAGLHLRARDLSYSAKWEDLASVELHLGRRFADVDWGGPVEICYICPIPRNAQLAADYPPVKLPIFGRRKVMALAKDLQGACLVHAVNFVPMGPRSWVKELDAANPAERD